MAQEKTTQEIIDDSGNGFHSRVVSLLRKNEWSVLVSPYYSDNFTDKPREIDIIANRQFRVSRFMGDSPGVVNVRLFIECKYVKDNIVFWFDKKDKESAIVRAVNDTGLPEPEGNATIKTNHYVTGDFVAKIYSSGSKKNEDNEFIAKAINQNLNATIYYRDRGNLKPVMMGQRTENVLRNVPYPILVVNSFKNFYRTDMDGNGNVNSITDPFQLEVHYAYTDKDRNAHDEYFLIDVVSIDKLPAFLTLLETTDIDPLRNQIAFSQRRGE